VKDLILVLCSSSSVSLLSGGKWGIRCLSPIFWFALARTELTLVYEPAN